MEPELLYYCSKKVAVSGIIVSRKRYLYVMEGFHQTYVTVLYRVMLLHEYGGGGTVPTVQYYY